MKNLKIFAVSDKVNGNGLVITGTAYTAGGFVRDSLPFFRARCPNFMSECELYEIGEFSEDDFSIVSCVKVPVSWDCYKAPEIPVSHLPSGTPLPDSHSSEV